MKRVHILSSARLSSILIGMVFFVCINIGVIALYPHISQAGEVTPPAPDHAPIPNVTYSKKLRWIYPKQKHPVKISIKYGKMPGTLDISRKAYPYWREKVRNVPTHNVTVIKLDKDEDAVITLPKTKILKLAGLLVLGGRHVRIIGGHIEAVKPANKGLKALLRFAGTSGSVFVEGMIIDTKKQYGLDGIDVGSVRHKADLVADIYVQNCLIRGIYSTTKGLHADGYQFYGDTKWTRMDKVSVESYYQGLFLDPQAEIEGIDLRRVDISYPDPDNATGYAFFLRVEKGRYRRPPIYLDEVYVTQRKNMPLSSPWEEFSIYPPASRPGGAVLVDGNKACFPSYPEVKGCVKKGSPPSGHFVTEKDAGLNYKSPGYEDAPDITGK